MRIHPTVESDDWKPSFTWSNTDLSAHDSQSGQNPLKSAIIVQRRKPEARTLFEVDPVSDVASYQISTSGHGTLSSHRIGSIPSLEQCCLQLDLWSPLNYAAMLITRECAVKNGLWPRTTTLLKPTSSLPFHSPLVISTKKWIAENFWLENAR